MKESCQGGARRIAAALLVAALLAPAGGFADSPVAERSYGCARVFTFAADQAELAGDWQKQLRGLRAFRDSGRDVRFEARFYVATAAESRSALRRAQRAALDKALADSGLPAMQASFAVPDAAAPGAPVPPYALVTATSVSPPGERRVVPTCG